MCSNPIHVYQLIKVATFFKKAEETDLTGTILALKGIQHTYQLSTEDVASGQIGKRKTHAFLNAKDCLHIAQTAVAKDRLYYADAITWTETASKLSPENAEIKDFLIETKQLHDEHQAVYNHSDIEYIHTLCRGEQMPKVGYCEYRTNNDLWFLLSPLKAEILDKEFPLVIFHQLVSNKEIELMKKQARKNMERSRVVGKDHSFQRIQSSAWLRESDHDLLQIISKRLDHALQLSVSNDVHISSEPFQIGFYPPGGFYEQHYDAFGDEKGLKENLELDGSLVGNRIATLMFYLSGTVDGGATVFPNLWVSIFPTKGSAVFWYNLNKDGSLSEKSLHAACPTIFGIKCGQ